MPISLSFHFFHGIFLAALPLVQQSYVESLKRISQSLSFCGVLLEHRCLSNDFDALRRGIYTPLEENGNITCQRIEFVGT